MALESPSSLREQKAERDDYNPDFPPKQPGMQNCVRVCYHYKKNAEIQVACVKVINQVCH